jgi:RNA polymerase sigma-70 factor (ECF subfamily)
MYGVGMVEVDPGRAAPLVAGFDEFYEAEYQPLRRLALALSGSANAADDLVQETMLRTYRHWAKVSTYDKPGAWARRVLLNLATSRGRRLAVEARGLLRLRHASPATVLPEENGAVWAAVRALPKREAQAIALFYLEDLAVAEIAALLECAEGTVKSLLHRARKSLAAQLGEVDE